MNGISAFIKGLRDFPNPFHHVRTQQGTNDEQVRGPLLEGDHADTLIMNLPVSRM